MNTEILGRFFIALALIAFGWVAYYILGRLILIRANRKRLGLEGFAIGSPAILYFTTPHCIPCKTVQRPALAELKAGLGEQIQIIQVDAVERPDLADFWGVLSVPTTFIIDSHGEPRMVNHGVTDASKLLGQIEKVEGRKLLDKTQKEEKAKPQPVSLTTD